LDGSPNPAQAGARHRGAPSFSPCMFQFKNPALVYDNTAAINPRRIAWDVVGPKNSRANLMGIMLVCRHPQGGSKRDSELEEDGMSDKGQEI